MANTVVKQVLHDGDRHYVVKLHLESDGVSGEETATNLVDVSTLTDSRGKVCTDVVLMALDSSLTGFTIELYWDATANTHLYNISDYDVDVDFEKYGGISNNAGAGKTGDVLFTTAGFTAATDTGHIVLSFIKKYD
jgi:hypothetical protein